MLSTLIGGWNEVSENVSEAHAFCSDCGAVAYHDDKYCACCGGAVIRVCSACGVPVRHPIAHFCSHCGRAFADARLHAAKHGSADAGFQIAKHGN